jgi:hypothetical protein
MWRGSSSLEGMLEALARGELLNMANREALRLFF